LLLLLLLLLFRRKVKVYSHHTLTHYSLSLSAAHIQLSVKYNVFMYMQING